MEFVNFFDLFIFDFDGTIMNNEHIHHLSYSYSLFESLFHNNQKVEHLELIDENENYKELIQDFTYEKYEQLGHSVDLLDFKYYCKFHFGITNYNHFYQRKQDIYVEIIKKMLENVKNENNNYHWGKMKLCDGIEELLQKILEQNKQFVIVTNSSKKNIHLYASYFPILFHSSKIYTKDDFHYKKPHPECYLKVLHDFPHFTHKICFEDSLRGLASLYKIPDIYPIFVQKRMNYGNLDYINNKMKNVKKVNSINEIQLEENEVNSYFEKYHENKFNQINCMIENYKNEIDKNTNRMKEIIHEISLIIQNKHSCNQIFLTGMGKSGYICKKSASTWQSLSLPCVYLDLPNLPHGDFGILKEDDIIIFISNSGNTDEIVFILEYLKYRFHKKVYTISIVANQNSKMEELSDVTFVLKNITESDDIQMTPSTSSSIFMMILDMIAIETKRGITKDEFKINHPAGSLGKR